MRKCTIGWAVAILAIAGTTPAGAVDQFWSGDGAWDTVTASWGAASGGPYTSVWAGDGAVFEGAGGTVTLGEAISVNSMMFNVANYTVAGNTLNFGASAAPYQIFNSVNNVNQTITSAITGSPTVGVASNTSQSHGLVFAPDIGTQTLGTITMAVEDGSGDKCAVTLGGSTVGNSVASVNFDAGHRWANLIKDGSGTWTVGDIDNGTVEIKAGNFMPTGTIYTRYRGIELKGGTFHYNSEVLVTGGPLKFYGGDLDNTSGGPIAVPTEVGGTPVYQPTSQWAGDVSFIGTDDLDLGAGKVTMTADRTVNVQASTLTFGGTIADGSGFYSLTKTGAGTLAIGTPDYNGDTTVSAGTLSIGAATLDDASTVVLAGGTTLNLAYTDTDTVFHLDLGGTPAAAGVWGAPGSGAPNQSSMLTGTGFINTLGGVYTDGTFFWDGPNTGGTGDGASDGGAGTWSSTNANWDRGFVAREPWSPAGPTAANKATFGGSGGTVTLTEDISIKEIVFTGGNYTMEGGALMFRGDGLIHMNAEDQNQTFKCRITGSPAVRIKSGAHNPYNQITFAPELGVTQTIGDVISPYRASTGGDKGRVTLGGESTGNSVASINWEGSGMHYGLLEKVDSGTWTIEGDSNMGVIDVKAGKLIVNGVLTSNYAGLRFTGGTIGGAGSLSLKGVTVPAGAALAPGEGVGTLNAGKAGQPVQLSDGSIYEWEVGPDATTDTLNVTDGALNLDDFVLKVLDADGYVASAAVELTVFTYDLAKVTVDMSGWGGNIDTTALDDSWTFRSLALTDDGAGRIYLTGLSGGTPDRLTGDANGDGFVDDNDLSLLLANWRRDTDWAHGEFSGIPPVDDNDLSLLLANWTGAPPAMAVPEPAGLALLAIGGAALLRRKRR